MLCQVNSPIIAFANKRLLHNARTLATQPQKLRIKAIHRGYANRWSQNQLGNNEASSLLKRHPSHTLRVPRSKMEEKVCPMERNATNKHVRVLCLAFHLTNHSLRVQLCFAWNHQILFKFRTPVKGSSKINLLEFRPPFESIPFPN